MSMRFREAVQKDLDSLARMNQLLIRDEGHRNPMTLSQLRERMEKWLTGEYKAVVFSVDNQDVGYVLYRHDPEWIYLRQFYISPERRRRGLGLKAMEWLKQNPWRSHSRIRLDVLINNESAVAFWRTAGFREYCLTMEMENSIRG